jgi:hypothetical protein
VPVTHGEIAKAHGKTVTVCLCTANNTRRRVYAVCNFENAWQTLCRVLPPPAWQSKAANASQTSTETRDGPEIQSAMCLTFAVRCATRCLEQFAVSLPMPCALRVLVCRGLTLCHVLSVDICRVLSVAVSRYMPWVCSGPCVVRLHFAVCITYAMCQTSQVGSRSAPRRAQAFEAWHVPLPCACTRQSPSFFTFCSVFA